MPTMVWKSMAHPGARVQQVGPRRQIPSCAPSCSRPRQVIGRRMQPEARPCSKENDHSAPACCITGIGARHHRSAALPQASAAQDDSAMCVTSSREAAPAMQTPPPYTTLPRQARGEAGTARPSRPPHFVCRGKRQSFKHTHPFNNSLQVTHNPERQRNPTKRSGKRFPDSRACVSGRAGGGQPEARSRWPACHSLSRCLTTAQPRDQCSDRCAVCVISPCCLLSKRYIRKGVAITEVGDMVIAKRISESQRYWRNRLKGRKCTVSLGRGGEVRSRLTCGDIT
ncbi:hypothetical protein F5X68DRAFT_57881 [Plectosphaerella plurivora]|uniref:Uncharacterized protein n=1 Tax=Plectosphaerella plurivora TaxID=936078 RepID=A0A9P9AB56_9PEZI|nr:hypothetical protein F5X68DRAFT_57881 [Plectosphaerella plurivora]